MTTTRKPLTLLLALLVGLTLAAPLNSQPNAPPAAPPVADPISTTQAEALRGAAGTIEAVAKTLDVTPAPKPAEDWVAFPREPVSVGRFAVFTVAPDLTAVKWVTVARSTLYADPAFHVDSSGVTALVETATAGDFVVQAFGLRGGTTVYCVATLKVVGVGPQPVPIPEPGPTPPAPSPTPVPAPIPGPVSLVTYVYEKDDTAVTSEVHAGLNRLNREKKILATLFEEDTFDGDGEIPDQYRVSLLAAKGVGLPALVVVAGGSAVRIIPDRKEKPLTAEAIWEVAP